MTTTEIVLSGAVAFLFSVLMFAIQRLFSALDDLKRDLRTMQTEKIDSLDRATKDVSSSTTKLAGAVTAIEKLVAPLNVELMEFQIQTQGRQLLELEGHTQAHGERLTKHDGLLDSHSERLDGQYTKIDRHVGDRAIHVHV
jgi:hypothetical protein